MAEQSQTTVNLFQLLKYLSNDWQITLLLSPPVTWTPSDLWIELLILVISHLYINE